MSTLKADAVTAKSTNTDVVITGAGTGVPDIETGFKVSGTAGLPVNNLRTGTDGELITWDASGDPATVAVGTATHVLTSNGTGAAPTFQAVSAGGFTLATEQSTTSGTAVTFGSIPAGTKMIVIMFNDVSLDDTGNIDVHIGDAGGLETTGYIGQAFYFDTSGNTGDGATQGFKVMAGNAGYAFTGTMILTLEDAANFTWTGFQVNGEYPSSGLSISGGIKSLSAELTQLSVTSLSSDFDRGAINIMYQ